MDPVRTRHDRLVYEQVTTSDSDIGEDYLIFLIGGNPGLISYYEPFLSSLYEDLLESRISKSARFSIYANSLAGFDNGLLADGREASSPVGLLQQIENTENLIYDQIELHQKPKSEESEDDVPKVILIGHSVGGYILLEMIRRHKGRVERGLEKDFDLIGGILLFPTIVNIAKSPLGVVANVSPRSPARFSIQDSFG